MHNVISTLKGFENITNVISKAYKCHLTSSSIISNRNAQFEWKMTETVWLLLQINVNNNNDQTHWIILKG